MAFCDFVVKYDPKKDTQGDLTRRILYSMYIRPMKFKKPRITFIGGRSGEGKSLGYLTLATMLFEIQGLDVRDYLDVINIYVPIEYPQKIKLLLMDKRYKKANMIGLHEAREVIKAKDWHSFLTQAVADVNAMSRAIKRLAIFIISQFIRDITSDVRYTLNYYMIIRRPLGRKARCYIHVLWHDDRDLEKPKLRKRKLSGYIVDPKGRRRRFIPQYLELTMPPKDIIKHFEEKDREAKTIIIRRKLDKLMKAMEADLEIGSKKIDSMVQFYATNTENLTLIGKKIRDKWKLKPQVKDMHDLTPSEVIQFEQKLNEKLKTTGVITVEKEIL